MRGVSLGSPLPPPHCLWWLVHQSRPGPRTESPSRLRPLGSVGVYKHTWPDSPVADSNSDPCLPHTSPRSPCPVLGHPPGRPWFTRTPLTPAHLPARPRLHGAVAARTPEPRSDTRVCGEPALSAQLALGLWGPPPPPALTPPAPPRPPPPSRTRCPHRPAPRRPSLAPLPARPARPERGKEPPADRSGGRLAASFATATTSSLERCDARTPRACCRFRHVILGKKIKFEALSGPSACH